MKEMEKMSGIETQMKHSGNFPSEKRFKLDSLVIAYILTLLYLYR